MESSSQRLPLSEVVSDCVKRWSKILSRKPNPGISTRRFSSVKCIIIVMGFPKMLKMGEFG
ncbi:hypothetical protein REPUB_Repub17cG0013800 [Reevesia pubescens]